MYGAGAGDHPGPGNAMLYTAFSYPSSRYFFISVALVQAISFGSQEKQRRIWYFVPVRSPVPSLECEPEEEFYFQRRPSFPDKLVTMQWNGSLCSVLYADFAEYSPEEVQRKIILLDTPFCS